MEKTFQAAVKIKGSKLIKTGKAGSAEAFLRRFILCIETDSQGFSTRDKVLEILSVESGKIDLNEAFPDMDVEETYPEFVGEAWLTNWRHKQHIAKLASYNN